VRVIRGFFNSKEIEMTELTVPRRTEAEIEALVGAFEAGTLSNKEFNHFAHMTVAMWYLWQLPYAEAVTAMRGSIKHFAEVHGHTGLYHETITLFWLKLLRHYLDGVEAGTSLPEAVHAALTQLGDTTLMFQHYSRELLFSAEARAGWVEPDLRGLGLEG
jgi:hypothetical protein